MRFRGRAFLVLGVALHVPGCTAATELEIRVGGDGVNRPCFAEIDGRAIPADDLPGVVRRWRGREARLVGDANTPYRCMGGIIYALQRAGFGKIGFLITPPAPDE